MGQVFLAERLQIGGRVALKVLHANFANHPEMAARFFNEARAANSVEHAGIVKVYEYGRLPDGGAFIAMEFVDGPSLRHRLTEQRKLSPQTASRLARQMATALAAAHARGVVHRDLKPDNVMLVPDPEAAGGERVKILDFGIAKILWDLQHNDSHTKTGTFMGTPAYMSPEQCRDTKSVGPKGDVYALGAILYEMLSGLAPFGPGNAMELAVRIVTERPIALREREQSIPPELAGLVDLLLAKDPDSRPSMAEVASKLRLLGESVVDPKPEQPLHTVNQGETVPLLRAIQMAESAESSKTPVRAPAAEPVTAPRPKTLALEPPSTPLTATDSLATSSLASSDSLATRPLQKSDAPSNVKSLQQQPAFAVEPKHKTNKKSGRMLYLVPGIIVLLGAGLAGGSMYRAGRVRTEGNAVLSSIEEALKKEDWSSSIRLAEVLIGDTRHDATLRESAGLQLDKARKEQLAQSRFAAQQQFASRGDMDSVSRVFGEIPSDSVYKERAKALYSDVVDRLVTQEMQAARDARERDACPEMQDHLQRVLSILPKHAEAKELDAATCPIPKPNPDLGIADAVTQAGSDTAQAGSASTSSGAAQATPSVASKLAEKSPAQQVASAVIRGNFRLAHDLAKQNSKTDPSLWLQAGEAACRMRNLQLAIEAREHLPVDKQQLLAERCLRIDMPLGVASPGGKTIEPDKVLDEAYRDYLNGNYARAIALARPMVGHEPKRAWRIIGAAACGSKDISVANQAFRGLDKLGRQFLVHACHSNGLEEQNGSFVLAD
mgnify:FL=1